MSEAAAGGGAGIGAAELRALLEDVLGGRIARLDRRPSPYASSHPLEELDVELDDGSWLALVLKDCGRTTPASREARPEFADDPARPIAVHRGLLPAGPPGPPRCHGAIADPARERWWLILERVEGSRLAFVGEIEMWRSAARWLASFHARFAGRTEAIPAGRLLRYDAALYRRWMRRAAARFDGDTALMRLAARWETVVDRLVALPPTLLHGEFYADNVLVKRIADGTRICPVDWETAGWGPGPLDLAALVSGSWSEPERRDLALVYHESLAAASGEAPSVDGFLAALDLCRLQVAVQWIGWLGRREPPPWQRHDWRAEAVRLAERVIR